MQGEAMEKKKGETRNSSAFKRATRKYNARTAGARAETRKQRVSRARLSLTPELCRDSGFFPVYLLPLGSPGTRRRPKRTQKATPLL